jgi:exopolysaccharide biosynthesis polyprenyl glycosylphosphotransferase
MKTNAIRTYYILFDFLAAVITWILFYLFRKHIIADYRESMIFTLIGSGIIIGLFWLFIYGLFGFYVEVYRRSRVKETLMMLVATIIGVTIISLAILLDDAEVIARKQFYIYTFMYFVIHWFIASLFRVSVTTHIKNLTRKGIIYFNTIIIGSQQNAQEIYTELQGVAQVLGYKFIGYVHIKEESEHLIESLTHLGSYEHLESIIKEQKIEDVIIAIEPSEHKRIEQILNNLEGLNLRINIIPDIYQILLGSVSVSHVFGAPLVEIRQNLMPVWQQFLKRSLDIFASLCVLILGSPFYLFIAIMTRMSSPGPIFYSQERIGKGGLPFLIYKFRSMYIDAEKAGPKLSTGDNDPRITPWGRFMRKTRLDEFPQFYNVLIGDMSLVGPRPERQFFIDQIVKIAPHYKHLNRIRPGITSLGQVKFGYAENVEQMVRRLKYDIIYLENMSLAMDFRIMIYTVLIIFKGSGK